MKNLVNSIVFLALIGSAYSCSQDDNFIDKTQSSDQNQENVVGRFDNSPFVWDTDSTQNKNDVFIGDLNIKSPSTRSANDILIDAPVIFPGMVLSYENVRSGRFDGEIKRRKKPYDLVFEFADQLAVEDIADKGTYASYSKHLSNALQSSNFQKHINQNFDSEVEYSSTECYSYSDVEKGISGGASFAKAFTSKMSSSRKNTKYKSIYLGIVSVTSFGVSFDANIDGFFQDDAYNKNESEYYIKRIKYGKYAYIAIESQYSYDEVKTHVEAAFKLWKIGASGGYDKKTVEILSKSVITIMAIGNVTGNTPFWGTSLDPIIPLFQPKFNNNSYGLPIFVEARNMADDLAYAPPYSSSNSVSPRPSYSSSSRPTTRPSYSSSGRLTTRPSYSSSGRPTTRPIR